MMQVARDQSGCGRQLKVLKDLCKHAKGLETPLNGAEMNIFHAEFTLRQVSDAIQTNPETIKTWMKKGLIFNAPTDGDGPGTRRLHSFFGVMEMAVAAALIDAGVRENEVVFQAARFFAHTGDGPLGDRPGRVPGCPFPQGLTYVAVGNGRSKEVLYRPGKDMMAETRHELGGPEVIIFVEINSIFDRVVTALGHNLAEVRQIANGSVSVTPRSGFVEN